MSYSVIDGLVLYWSVLNAEKKIGPFWAAAPGPIWS